MNNKTIMDWRRRLKNMESAQNLDVVTRAFIRTLACSVGMLLDRAVLVEAIMISVTGGLIGVLLGMGASAAVESVVKWPISVQPWTVMLAFAVCTFTGIFFGWYPAKKAANLDPIEAIRYE